MKIFYNRNRMVLLFLLFSSLFATSCLAQAWQGRNANFSNSNWGETVYAINDSVAWTWGVELDQNGGGTLENNTISKTKNNGLDWFKVTPPFAKPTFISSLFAFDFNHAWITYVEYPEGSTGAQGDNWIVRTMDGGTSWDTVNLVVNVFVDFVYMWNFQEGIVVGDADDQGFEIYKTTDGGQTWNRILTGISVDSTEYIFKDNYAVRGDQLWFASTEGKIFHTQTKGADWLVYDSNQSGFNLMNVNDNGDVFLITNKYLEDEEIYLYSLFRRDFVSGVWQITNEDSSYMFDVQPVPLSDAIISTNYKYPDYFTQVSYDRGDSWVTIDVGNRASYLSFFNPESGYAAQINGYSDPSSTLVYRYRGSPLTGLIKQAPLLNVSINMTPNPTSGNVTINVTSSSIDNYWIMLHDLAGNLHYKSEFFSIDEVIENIDLTVLPTGIYTITVSNTKGVRTEKLIRL